MTVGGSWAASTRRLSAFGPAAAILATCALAFSISASVGSNFVDVRDDHADLAGLLVIDAAADEHDRVVGDHALGGGQRLLEDHDLDRAVEVVERREHHRRARARLDLLGLGDHAADLHPLAVALVDHLGGRAVGLDLQRLAHALERVLGDEDADRLLLHRQQLGALVLVDRDRRVGRRVERRGVGRRPASKRSKIEPWPICASCWVRWPAACAESSTSSMPLRVAPVEPNAPHLISASIERLLTVRASTRSQKSHSDVKSPVLRARLLDRLHRRVADALDGVQPEADVALHDHELVVGEVHVRRQDLDPHRLGLVDEERDLVLGVHDRGDQRGHVLGGVVGLQPRRPVGDQRVTGGVGLVERVVGGLLVGRPQRLDRRPARRRWRGSPR